MSHKMYIPAVSIIIVSKNSGPKLKKCLKSISTQNYPTDKIEILIVDGGSVDNSADLAVKYKARFIDGGFPDNMEARRHIGAKYAKAEILAYIDSDNYLPEPDWLLKMIKPFEDQQIFASQPLFYQYRKQDPLFNRYFALFGVNDPVAFYLGKADRLPYYTNSWSLLGKAKDSGNYFDVELSEPLPTVGCNGFLIRRLVLREVLKEPEDFFHIDVVLDLVKKGYRHMAFVKIGIIHDTSDNFQNLVHKRLSYFQKHGVNLASRRRYKVYDSDSPRDNFYILLFVISTLTIIRPLFDSIRGFVKKPDVAWFLHPLVCFIFLYVYALIVLRSTLTKLLNGRSL